MDGVSMVYTFDKENANAPSTHKTQYFEMIGDRAIHLEVDGGVSPDTAGIVAGAGADVLVAGSAIYKGDTPEDYGRNIAAIRAAAEAAM